MQILEDLLALFLCLDEASMGLNPNGQCSLLTALLTLQPVGLCFFSQWDLLATGKRQFQTFRLKGAHHLSRPNAPNHTQSLSHSSEIIGHM